jgi:uracil phosphoribosyltransferase
MIEIGKRNDIRLINCWTDAKFTQEEKRSMREVKVLEHPLVAHHLTVLRNRETPTWEFRQTVNRLSMLLAYEATKGLPTEDLPVETPITRTIGKRLQGRIGIVPILRAGLGMVDAMLQVLPMAEVWHLGLYRDEETARPVSYYNKLPKTNPVDMAFILDPMLATGGSAQAAYQALERWGVGTIKMLSVIAVPEGISQLRASCPKIEIHTCSVDQGLNEHKFIVPGLGDAGDRIFNTLH